MLKLLDNRRRYTLAWWLAVPLVMLYLLARSLRQREYRAHWGERFLGRGARSGDAQPVIWVHAVSVGETRAAQPLVEALAAQLPAAQFMLTHMTPTGRAVGEAIVRAAPGRVQQRYLPYELPFAQARFLREVRPALGVILETEVWPNLMASAHAAGVPVALVNARLSEKSLARALRLPALMREAASRFAWVGAQTAADQARLAQLFAGPLEVTGNLKFDLAPDPQQIEAGRATRARLGRPVWLLASTREGEEALLLDALRGGQVDGTAPAATAPAWLVVPRHPQRFDAVAALFAARGLVVRRRSQGARLEALAPGEVYLGDTMGELPWYYGAADAAVIGGSLLPFGAQNLIEAAACGCPVILGPSTYNFAQAAQDALAAGAAVQVADATAAVQALAALTADPARQSAMRAAALAFAQAHRGATARTAERLAQWLLARGPGGAGAPATSSVAR
jgi:3-deoxy-D-manno-octulosonic-acid transferase